MPQNIFTSADNINNGDQLSLPIKPFQWLSYTWKKAEDEETPFSCSRYSHYCSDTMVSMGSPLSNIKMLPCISPCPFFVAQPLHICQLTASSDGQNHFVYPLLWGPFSCGTDCGVTQTSPIPMGYGGTHKTNRVLFQKTQIQTDMNSLSDLF